MIGSVVLMIGSAFSGYICAKHGDIAGTIFACSILNGAIIATSIYRYTNLQKVRDSR